MLLQFYIYIFLSNDYNWRWSLVKFLIKHGFFLNYWLSVADKYSLDVGFEPNDRGFLESHVIYDISMHVAQGIPLHFPCQGSHFNVDRAEGSSMACFCVCFKLTHLPLDKIFLKENIMFLFCTSHMFLPNFHLICKLPLSQVISWHQAGDKPLLWPVIT